MSYTLYPAALDTFTDKVDGVDDVLAADFNKLQDAMKAMEVQMGVTNSGDTNSFDYRLRDAVALGSNVNDVVNGAPGMPRITSKAIVRALSVVVGNNIMASNDSVNSVASVTYVEVYSYRSQAVTGSVRIYAEQYTDGGSVAVGSYLRFLKNGVQLAVWYMTSSTPTARIFDTTITLGDRISIEMYGGGCDFEGYCYAAYVRNRRILVDRPVIDRPVPVYADEDGIYA
jgi:hypothetical protein